MKCPHCNENHPYNNGICPVTGKRIDWEWEKTTYNQVIDSSWFVIGTIGIIFLAFGLALLNDYSIIEFISNIGKNDPSVSSKFSEYEGKIVEFLYLQLNSNDRQIIAYNYGYDDSQENWEFERENIYFGEISGGVDETTASQISFAGRSRNPVWSPDGRYLAYVAFGSNDWDSGWIVIYDIETQQNRIIQGDFVPNNLSWSPDGTKISFSDIKNNSVLIIILETESIQIVDTDGHWVDGPTWSLDGRFLAYVQTKGSNTNNDDAWVLKIIDLETMEISQVTTVNDNIGILRQKDFILWTADGHYLIYVRFNLINGERQGYELWVLDPLTLETYKLEEDMLVADQRFYPWLRIWSPFAESVLGTEPIAQYESSDSVAQSAITSSSVTESEQDLILTNTPTEIPRQSATPTLLPSSTPTVPVEDAKPEGDSMIAYALGDFADADIYIMNVNSGNTQRITNNYYEDKSPSFSPDNKKLVYQSKREQGWELYVYDLETGEEKRITNFSGEAKFPSWSPIPGDERIVFEGREGTSGAFRINVWMVNADGSGVEKITNTNTDNRPIWSGDGSLIIFGRATKDTNGDGRVYSTDNLDIYTIDPENKNIRRITETDNIDEFQFGSSPNGTQIVFCAVSGDANHDGLRNLQDTRDIHFINIDGGERKTVELNDEEIYSPDFSPDGQFITFNIWFNDNDSAIWLYHLPTGKITELTDTGSYYHPEWSH